MGRHAFATAQRQCFLAIGHHQVPREPSQSVDQHRTAFPFKPGWVRSLTGHRVNGCVFVQSFLLILIIFVGIAVGLIGLPRIYVASGCGTNGTRFIQRRKACQ